ncbi:MAG: TldD/PmbA family protein [Deltaproteobacteria bacterium]|jgi:PmbA protein|nr:TldD/PmbA family protein [Deltaproteobacteria bacterium]
MKNTKSSRKHMEKTASFLIEKAKKAGCKQISAKISKNRSNKVAYRDGKWEEIKGSTTYGANVKLYIDGKYASHSTSDLKKESLEKFIKEAVTLTRYLEKDKDRHLPSPDLYPKSKPGNLQIFDNNIDSLDLAKRKKIAKIAGDSARSHGGKTLISASSGFGDNYSEYLMVNSNGFTGFEKRTSFYLYAGLSIMDPAGGRPSDYAVSSTRYLADLTKAPQIGKLAAERTTSRLGARKIKSGKLPVIIENRAARRVMAELLSPLSARAFHSKQSCFDKSIGKQIASSKLQLFDNPLLTKGLGTGYFDSEGIGAKKLSIIKNGKLDNIYVDTYYGTKINMDVTTGDRSNIMVQSGKHDLEALLQKLNNGILITHFNGGNSNSTTGDFSHGIKGFLIKNGKRFQPIKELNIADNHKTFWKKIQFIGNDPYQPSSYRIPSIMIGPISVAGK